MIATDRWSSRDYISFRYRIIHQMLKGKGVWLKVISMVKVRVRI